MKRAALAALMLWPFAGFAHDVPDDVRIRVFLKPEGDRMTILVRIPANALIDILFPMLPGSPLLDLKQIDGFALEGARVWVADLLSLYEDGHPLPRPQVVRVRVSRRNDPFFASFQKALEHVNGDRLPFDTDLVQDDASVDALLETPIRSANSAFSFEPRFARVGVRVTTTLAFLTADGGVRQFEYEADPEAFQLNPTRYHAAVRFLRSGFEHYLRQTDYWLFLLCVALVFRRFRDVVLFATAFGAAQSFALICSAFGLAFSSPWIVPLWGVLIAAAIVYMGIEAIVTTAPSRSRLRVSASEPRASASSTRDSTLWLLAVVTGLVFGSGFWLALQPLIQFGGMHGLTSALAFDAGIQMSQILALALLVPAVALLLRFSSAPRVAAIIAAAIAIRISWHRMLDRARALSLQPMNLPALNPGVVALAALAAAAIVIAFVYRARRITSAPQ
jgi:hypothetical protein